MGRALHVLRDYGHPAKGARPPRGIMFGRIYQVLKFESLVETLSVHPHILRISLPPIRLKPISPKTSHPRSTIPSRHSTSPTDQTAH